MCGSGNCLKKIRIGGQVKMRKSNWKIAMIFTEMYIAHSCKIYIIQLTIILLMLPSIPPECADLITSRDRPPIVEETLVTVNKSTTVKSCTSKQNTCKLPLLLGAYQSGRTC